MRAGDLMSTEVVQISPETPVAAVARLLADRGISAVPVVESDGRVVGLVTEADLIRRLAGAKEQPRGWLQNLLSSAPEDAARYAKTHGARARDVMTTNVVSVEESTAAEDIAQLMEERGVKRVLVLRDGKLAGVVSRADLLEAVMAPRDASATAADDGRIRRAVLAAMRDESWTKAYYLWVTVERGVVTFHGYHNSPDVSRALRVLAEGVLGVQGVEFKIELPPAWLVGKIEPPTAGSE